jgi:hypothetical protein
MTRPISQPVCGQAAGRKEHSSSQSEAELAVNHVRTGSPSSANGMDRRCSPQYPASNGVSGSKEPAIRRQPNEAIAVLGIDIGKNTFHLIGLNKVGAIICASSSPAPTDCIGS